MEPSAPVEFRDIRIAVPWGYISGRWYGERRMRPILALHGWLDNIGTWDTLIPLLAAHVGVLCIDLPGHGQSSKFPSGILYHMLDFVPIVKHVMKEYGWRQVSLMGHSLGSLVAFIYAALYPHTVDLLIAIDIIEPAYIAPAKHIDMLALGTEKLLIEVERLDQLNVQEPPSYSYEELEEILHRGSAGSVALDKCKHILNRSIARSRKYPQKFYFSRDGRVKYYTFFSPPPDLSVEMAKRIGEAHVPYLVVKGTRSAYIKADSDRVIDVLRRSDPHFEMHHVEGTHHVHLNNPHGVVAVLNPFLNRYRPTVSSLWSMGRSDELNDNDDDSNGDDYDASAGHRGLKWSRSKL